MHNNIMAAGSRDRPPMLATGRYAQWRSRFLRYIDTRPNGDALRKCILEVPEDTTVETVLNMSPENKAHYESEKEAIHLLLTRIRDEIYSTVDACKTAHEMWEAIEMVGSIVSISSTRLHPEWQGFRNNCQRNKQVGWKFHSNKLFGNILKQYQKEVNELRAERIAKNANPLALVTTALPYQDPYYQTSKSHKSSAPTSKASLLTRSHATTRHKGKETAKPIIPPSESAFEEDSDPEQAQKDKEYIDSVQFYLVQGNITINRVYYVEGLNHNLFSVGQFCDADLEVAFQKSTCFVRDLQKNDLLTGNRGSDLYTISLQETTSSTLICLMAKASPTQAWLWHRRLSHLNFNYINLLSKKDVVIGLPKLKYSWSKIWIRWKEKGDPCILVGYSTQFQKDIRVYIIESRLLVESIHLKFDEIKDMSETFVANDTSGLSNYATLINLKIQGYQWIKDHPLTQVRGNPSKPVQTRRQLATNPEMCMFALTMSIADPKNIKESMADSTWIEAMQEELHQFDKLQV
ncbi:integrase, catalytic region, zinc finger, CCHC-type containing protein [Tanacetum coccineum]